MAKTLKRLSFMMPHINTKIMEVLYFIKLEITPDYPLRINTAGASLLLLSQYS